jgi:signal transduction histidine kinase
MLDRFRWLITPLNCTAYLTWATLLAAMLSGSFDVGGTNHTNIAALMLVFLAAFVFEAWWSERSSRPAGSVVALAIEILATLALISATPGLAPALLVVIVVQAVKLPFGWRIALIGTANLGAFMLLASFDKGRLGQTVFLMYAGFQMFAGLTAHYARQAACSRDELVRVNAHLLATRSLLEESARDGERLRLARELHDVAGHKLTALRLQLMTLLQRGPADAQPEAATAADLAGELLDDLRGVVGQMRRHDGLDLKQAIEWLAAPLPHPQIHLDIDADARPDDVAQAQALLRTVQEALTNAVRHAGADHIWLTLRRERERIMLSIRDDGRGAARIRPGHGLNGMRERLEDIGGGLQLAGDDGFRVDAWVPVS